MPPPVTFVVPGIRRESATRGAGVASEPPIGRLKESVVLTAQRGGQDGDVRMTAVPGEDAVVVHIAGGPALWLHPDHARELLLAQHDPAAPRGAAAATPDTGETRVPLRLQWRLEEAVPARGAARGFLGDVLVRAIDVVTGLGADTAAAFAASAVVRRFDSRVDAGIYRLGAGTLTPLKGQPRTTIDPADGRSLVLIHGTFSETSGTFGKLWTEHPQLVRSLFRSYGDRVYALDHPTLGASPIANAITLAEAVPAGARLHLLTHSRGGLVAEVLARVCSNPADTFAAFPGDADAEDREDLKRLAALVTANRITVERVVRVACPARGTLLASKRLDAYVSVLKWALELAGAPVAPQLVEFLGEVARRRADPDALPGLAAQIPESSLVRWLHTFDDPIDGDLRVVAGDLQGDSVVTWVKTLLSDAFYWTDNDLVVQTRSMYGGTPRVADSTFTLDQGGKVSHFVYFRNTETATAIVKALTRESPEGFRVIGPLSWGGTSSTGVRAAIVPRSPAAAAEVPALFLLPGILGSHLRVGDERVWLGWRLVNGFARLAYGTEAGSDVQPDGPIGAFYDDLTAFLSSDHEVIPFGFDWRRPITDEASRLADAVDAALDARRHSGQPVRMLAHSMGGIVARTVQLVRPETWTRMMGVEGARVLMLGTPNEGSWAPMQVLSGDDTFGNVLSAVGAPFRGNATRQLIADFPGLLQLQAGLLDDLGSEARWKALGAADVAAIARHSVWHRLPLQLAQYEWGIPSQETLDGAVALRRSLDRQRERDLPAFAGKLLLVVGKAAFTPAGYEMADGGLVYLDMPDQGDGRVTLHSALLPGVATWTLDSEHGALPRRREAFDAYRELLTLGDTKRLARLSAPQVARGAAPPAAALVRSRPARAMVVAPPPQRETETLTPAGRAAVTSGGAAGAALRVTVVNGDLTYIADPLLIGHYRASRLTGAEAVMDRAVGYAMSSSLERGLYPAGPGTHQIFLNTNQPADNPWQLPRPQAVIVAGLGAEGELRGSHLVDTVRQAVIAWAQRLTERTPVPSMFSLAATLLGSGGSGITAGQAAQLLAQGVREANEQLAGERDVQRRWPRVEHVRVIELYLDRATEAWRALQELATASPALYVVQPVIEPGIGALRRPPDAGYRGAEYDFISVLMQKGENDDEQIVYTVDTKRARSEVRAQSTQVPLIRNLVSTASNNTNTDAQIGRTLFSLLVPVDLEPFMGSSTETVLELDEGTAGIPWELLDSHAPGSGDPRPWAIRTKLLRKLRTGAFQGAVRDASADDSVLVIGDPACDRTRYPRLLGARQEAAAVAACLASAHVDVTDGERGVVSGVTSLISPPDPFGAEPRARDVINAAMDRPWRIIHIAGHGEAPVAAAGRVDPRGVVLSDESFLGPREISALRVIPELVFVNCCHLASADADLLLTPIAFDRARFASGVAEALIRGGVRCVVAAGWAVDDEAARVFATTFYGWLLEGSRFIDAVAAARAEAHNCGGNTWAAYQCYGDPDWRYRRGTGDAQRPTAPPPAQQFGGIASAAALVLALEKIAVESEFQRADGDQQADRLRYLEDTHAAFWPGNGRVAEAFGNAWAKAGRFDEAVAWYERARTAPDSTASLAAVEQLANIRIRLAWTQVERARGDRAAAFDTARQQIADAIALLDTLVAIGDTIERESIYGSAYKRLALIEAAAGRTAQESDAIARMESHYAAAERIARAAGTSGTNLFYPAMNRIAAQLARAAGTGEAVALDSDTIDSVRRSMSAAPADFWSVVGQTELSVYASIAAGALATDLEALTAGFERHHARVSAPRMWASVHDNATFVLSKYRARASAAEAAAAGRLLATLATLAARAVPEGGGEPRRKTTPARPVGGGRRGPARKPSRKGRRRR